MTKWSLSSGMQQQQQMVFWPGLSLVPEKRRNFLIKGRRRRGHVMLPTVQGTPIARLIGSTTTIFSEVA